MSDPEATLFDVDEAHDPDTRAADLQTSAGLIALMAMPGVGSGRALKLARAFGSAEAFNAATQDERRAVASVAVDDVISVRPVDTPHESIRLLSYFDDEYPQALRDIKDAPAVLWVRGSMPEPARRIAIVGTRSATPWGVSMAEAIAEDAVAAGVSVVSGLALGIDIAAHRAVVAVNGHTTAVLGSGIDKVTPREHLRDAESIFESGGCLMTEQPPGTAPSARTLVARNRLQSGLSAATVVIQCGLKSGTMSTAKFTKSQGRTLVIPEPQDAAERTHPENAGSLSLLANGPDVVRLRTRDELRGLLATLG